jgi:hypothetical protein
MVYNQQKSVNMKAPYSLITIATLIICLYACKKDGNNINSSSIVGKWSIVSDSTFAGVGSSNHPVNYAGAPGDYFDFRTDGNVYTKEGAVLDTLSYKLVSNTTIIIASFGVTLNGVPETSSIKVLTSHNLTIDAPVLLTPGGEFGRKVSLSR